MCVDALTSYVFCQMLYLTLYMCTCVLSVLVCLSVHINSLNLNFSFFLPIIHLYISKTNYNNTMYIQIIIIVLYLITINQSFLSNCVAQCEASCHSPVFDDVDNFSPQKIEILCNGIFICV